MSTTLTHPSPAGTAAGPTMRARRARSRRSDRTAGRGQALVAQLRAELPALVLTAAVAATAAAAAAAWTVQNIHVL